MSNAQQAEHYRYSDYVEWPDNVRRELIEGEVYDMSPAPNRSHQKVLMEPARQLANYFADGGCEVYPAPFDVRLPEEGESPAEASTVVQPDISVICDMAKLDEAGCVGAPELLVEIISPYTASKDQLRKRRLYERHGVREFWIVHPVDALIRVYRLQPDGRYGRDEVYDATMTIESEVAKGFRLDVKTLF